MCFNGFKVPPDVCLEDDNFLTGYESLNISDVCDITMEYDKVLECVDKSTFKFSDIIYNASQLEDYMEVLMFR